MSASVWNAKRIYRIFLVGGTSTRNAIRLAINSIMNARYVNCSISHSRNAIRRLGLVYKCNNVDVIANFMSFPRWCMSYWIRWGVPQGSVLGAMFFNLSDEFVLVLNNFSLSYHDYHHLLFKRKSSSVIFGSCVVVISKKMDFRIMYTYEYFYTYEFLAHNKAHASIGFHLVIS